MKRPKSLRMKRNAWLLTEIKRIHQETLQTYGYPRITNELPPELKASQHTVYHLMKQHGIRSKMKRKYKATTNSKHNLPVAENLLDRQFSALLPNQKWVSDITYVRTEEGWLYLAGILDLHRRQMEGWSMDSRMKTELVVQALKQGLGRTKAEPGLLIHSDRVFSMLVKNINNSFVDMALSAV